METRQEVDKKQLLKWVNFNISMQLSAIFLLTFRLILLNRTCSAPFDNLTFLGSILTPKNQSILTILDLIFDQLNCDEQV